ncbi:MAG: fenitrothion hydrolase, partial [Actinobacteria bacterium]|nr:fenitrothion hydrolase [Actinomycetota bacterium]
PGLLAALAAVALVFPGAAAAHGIVGRADLPIPAWLFAWAAAVVIVISFVAMFRLRGRRLGALPRRELLTVPRVLEWLCGALGVGLFAVVVYAGLRGEQNFTSNLAPTAVYVVFWVGIPIVSAFVGDLWRPFNPWRAMARAGTALLRAAGVEPRPLLGDYRQRLGRYPAALTLVGFAWLELVYPSKDDPSLLAILALGYGAVQLVGMAAYGIETWTSRADGFSVYFSFIASLAPLGWRGRRLSLRPPLLGAREIEVLPGTAAVLFALIGSTSFDGFSNGDIWFAVGPDLQTFFTHFGLGPIGAYECAGTIGLAFWIGLVAGLYRLGIAGMARATGRPIAELSGQFIHTLVPIAFGYMLAHYFSLLVLQGQAVGYLISDPLGHGSNLFGTAEWLVNYNLISFAAIWYVQILAIVGGHVGGIVLSHERGLDTFSSARQSIRAQEWMLFVMVAFTCLALWILSAVTTATG